MAVLADRTINTLGGGHLEFEAIAQARGLLAELTASADPITRRFALGPSLGQCCGGVVHLRFELLDGPLSEARRHQLQAPLMPVALFGGGHVGQALVRLMLRLPMQVHWVDSRDEIFPSDLARQVHCEHAHPVHDAVNDLTPGSQVLIMSFSHAEDLDIVIACLKRQRERADLPFIGLIGSATKWATFRHRLRDRGFTPEEIGQVTCPIGVTGVQGKEPEVIAVAVAAQLLQQRP